MAVQSECGIRTTSVPAYTSAQSMRAGNMSGRPLSPAYSHYEGVCLVRCSALCLVQRTSGI